MKKLFITIGSFSLLSVALGQQVTIPSSVPQKTILVTKTDKEKVQEFQQQVKVKIEKHRVEMRAKKEVLEKQKDLLKDEIKNAKSSNNGKLTEEQKVNFKSKLDNIENQVITLRKENIQFLDNIDKERDNFFKSIKK
jgi:hypothetical protein